MKKIEHCIYCSKEFDSSKGEGDHIIPVQLGEFRGDVRFRRICPECNNWIGRSEQQFLRCGPESLFRDIVKPKVPRRRSRGYSRAKASMGVSGPKSTIDCGDHNMLVEPSKDNPTDVFSIDQIVIHDTQEREEFIRLFPGMNGKVIKERAEKVGIDQPAKLWLHCGEDRYDEYVYACLEAWPRDQGMKELPTTEVGVHQIHGRVTFMVSSHYFRSLAKIAFHYYLSHSWRGFRGDEDCFRAVREFIMHGENVDEFFRKGNVQFVRPYGKVFSGGVVTLKGWHHVFIASEVEDEIVVQIEMFVGEGYIPNAHKIRLAGIGKGIILPSAAWGHVYSYNDEESGQYAGQVMQAEVNRLG